MNAPPGAVDTATRLVRVAGELWPTTKAYLRLLRAETELAREGLPALAVWSAIASLGIFIALAALVAGAVEALLRAGWSLPAVTALVAGLGVVLAGLAGWAVYERIVHLTLPQTRRRVRVLLELVDDD